MHHHSAFAAPAVFTNANRTLRSCHLRKHVDRSRKHASFYASANPARTAAITGPTTGIGFETSKRLIRTLPNLNHILLLCRSPPKAQRLSDFIQANTPPSRDIKVSVIPLELADLKSVDTCAEQVMQTLGDHSLDLLMCNAGIMACPMTFSNYGVEMQYAVNHLSHARLTMRLMPSLREHHGGRVIFVSSMAVAFARSRKSAPRLDEKARDVVTDANYAKWAAYGDSKLAMSLFAKAVAQKEHNVESVSLHPGIVQTELGRYIVPEKLIPLLGKDPGFLGKAMSVFGFKTPDQGADLSVELAGLKRGGLQNGELYMKSGTLAEKSIAPLLSEKKEWEAVYDDVVKFMDWA